MPPGHPPFSVGKTSASDGSTELERHNSTLRRGTSMSMETVGQ